jgi:8-oxo-dGTP pyrophosphatase MutT (NUDIX family)
MTAPQPHAASGVDRRAEAVRRLQEAMAAGLPGRVAHRRMAHELAYGRHQGPVPRQARRAAVVAALVPTADGWVVPAILRPETMSHHGGQISLPGGLIESGETPHQAALREFEEELGTPAAALCVVGTLSPVYVFVSGFAITPVLAVAAHRPIYHPNPQEVAAVVELPLATLADPACRGRHQIERRGLVFEVPHFAVGPHRVWGATSLILAELVALAQRAQLVKVPCSPPAGTK